MCLKSNKIYVTIFRQVFNEYLFATHQLYHESKQMHVLLCNHLSSSMHSEVKSLYWITFTYFFTFIWTIVTIAVSIAHVFIPDTFKTSGAFSHIFQDILNLWYTSLLSQYIVHRSLVWLNENCFRILWLSTTLESKE